MGVKPDPEIESILIAVHDLSFDACMLLAQLKDKFEHLDAALKAWGKCRVDNKRAKKLAGKHKGLKDDLHWAQAAAGNESSDVDNLVRTLRKASVAASLMRQDHVGLFRK